MCGVTASIGIVFPMWVGGTVNARNVLMGFPTNCDGYFNPSLDLVTWRLTLGCRLRLSMTVKCLRDQYSPQKQTPKFIWWRVTVDGRSRN